MAERRTCQVLGQPHLTQRYQLQVRGDEEALTKTVVRLARKYGRYGYRRITALLRRAGWRVNRKRVERIWRQESLNVPKKQPKRSRLWVNEDSCVRFRPQHRTHVWAYGFVATRTHDGCPLCLLAIEVARALRATDVLHRLAKLFLQYGRPEYICWDNAPEFTAKAVRQGLKQLEVGTLCIDRGARGRMATMKVLMANYGMNS